MTVDIRDRAGWSDEAGAAVPKIAALVAAAEKIAPPAKVVDVESEGRCLILGRADVAVPAGATVIEGAGKIVTPVAQVNSIGIH